MSDGDSMARLGTPACLAFPFRVGAAGPAGKRRGGQVTRETRTGPVHTPGAAGFSSLFGGRG